MDQNGNAKHKRMYLRLHFKDGAGHPLTLVGHKEVRDERGFDVWSDTSTLYTRIMAGHIPAGEPEAELHSHGHSSTSSHATSRAR